MANRHPVSATVVVRGAAWLMLFLELLMLDD